MVQEKTFLQLINAFIRINNRFNHSNSLKRTFGTDTELYPSEIHTLDAIGSNSEPNVTELSEILAVTKGAVSQVIRKLEDKGLITRYQRGDNNRQVFLKLTRKGKAAFQGHRDFHKRQYDYIRGELQHLTDRDFDLLLHAFAVIENSFDIMD